MNQLTLLNQAQELNNTLQAIKPDNSQTTQLITYALIATAIMGIMVYHIFFVLKKTLKNKISNFVFHYIKEQERLE